MNMKKRGAEQVKQIVLYENHETPTIRISTWVEPDVHVLYLLKEGHPSPATVLHHGFLESLVNNPGDDFERRLNECDHTLAFHRKNYGISIVELRLALTQAYDVYKAYKSHRSKAR